MIKLRSKRFSRSSSKLGNGSSKGGASSPEKDAKNIGEIKWELRPGGMLVQKRESSQSDGEGVIAVRVSTVSQWHDISIDATSTFGNALVKKPSFAYKPFFSYQFHDHIYPICFFLRVYSKFLFLG